MKKFTPLKEERLRSGLLQIELAVRAGISRPRLSEIECGHIAATADEVAKLAAVLGIPVTSLSGEASDE